jgi:hypothetical protein
VGEDADHFVVLVIHLTTTARRALVRGVWLADKWQTLTMAIANYQRHAVQDDPQQPDGDGVFILADVTSALRAYYSTKAHDGVIYRTTLGCRDEVSRQTW